MWRNKYNWKRCEVNIILTKWAYLEIGGAYSIWSDNQYSVHSSRLYIGRGGRIGRARGSRAGDRGFGSGCKTTTNNDDFRCCQHITHQLPAHNTPATSNQSRQCYYKALCSIVQRTPTICQWQMGLGTSQRKITWPVTGNDTSKGRRLRISWQQIAEHTSKCMSSHNPDYRPRPWQCMAGSRGDFPVWNIHQLSYLLLFIKVAGYFRLRWPALYTESQFCTDGF